MYNATCDNDIGIAVNVLKNYSSSVKYQYRQYLQDLEEVKAMSIEAPASEQDFQPLCESSRLSVASPRVSLVSPKGLNSSPLPPMSPRTPRTPEPASDSSSPFFLERNIDQVWNCIHGNNIIF